MEERVLDVQDDVKDIKSDIKTILAKFEKQAIQQEKKFITRLEGKVAIGVITLLIAVMSFWFKFNEHVK